MLRKTMIVLLTAAALTGGVTADAFARGDGGGGGGQVPLDASAAGMGMHGGAHAFPSRGHFHFAQHHRFFSAAWWR
jgi:hypothetical protein